MRTLDVDLLPAQADLVEDETSSLVSYVGGMGGGKTRGGVYKALALGSINAPCAGLFVAPTYPMLRDVVARTFLDVLAELEIPHDWHKTEHILDVGGFQVYMRSGDTPERIIGFNAGWAIIDEPGQQNEEVAKRVLQRIRDPRAICPQLVFTGTPEGFNWLHKWLIAEPKEGTRIIRAKTRDNWHLSPEYIERLTERLTDEERAAYLDGEFINLNSGSVYKQFRRSVHVRQCASPLDGDLVMSCDFNVSRMCWVLGRAIDDEGHVWGEIIRENTNTFEQADAAMRLWQERIHDVEGHWPSVEEVGQRVTVYMDATGSARKTSAQRSDLAIIRDSGFANIRKPGSNPPVKDRVASVNDRLKRTRLFFDPACVELVRSLEQQVWVNDEPDKAAGLDHTVDALGYLVMGRPGWRVTTLKGNTVQVDPRARPRR